MMTFAVARKTIQRWPAPSSLKAVARTFFQQAFDERRATERMSCHGLPEADVDAMMQATSKLAVQRLIITQVWPNAKGPSQVNLFLYNLAGGLTAPEFLSLIKYRFDQLTSVYPYRLTAEEHDWVRHQGGCHMTAVVETIDQDQLPLTLFFRSPRLPITSALVLTEQCLNMYIEQVQSS